MSSSGGCERDEAAEVTTARVVLCTAVFLLAGCTQTITGTAVRTPPSIDEDSLSPIDVETLILGQTRMRAITGAGEDLSIVPSMDGKFPVDIDALADTVPTECRWVFAETQTFGDTVEEFHKTTFQNPPDGGLISEGVAGYRDPPTARAAFTGLVGRVESCASTASGWMLVGDWSASAETLQTRPYSGCGRDYRQRSVVLVEVTSCGFSESVPELIITNILGNLPG
jgi:hypothetical protein